MNRILLAPLLVGLMAGAASAQGLFHPDDVESMKEWAVRNATGQNARHLDCLETLNKNVRLLYGEPGLRLSSTVDLSMAALQRVGRAGPTQTYDFMDEDGRRTTGVTRPRTLRQSLWEGLLASANGARGYSVFGLSPLDGNHSVILVLDTHGSEPTVFWIDQWGTKGGWKEYPTKESLDGEIERLTSSWWASKLSELKIRFRSRSRLYPLVPTRGPEANLATMTRVPFLRMRSGPGTRHEQVRDADGNKRYFKKGDQFEIVERKGSWVRLRLPDGGEAWGHVGYMTLEHAPPAAPEVLASAASRGALSRLPGQ